MLTDEAHRSQYDTLALNMRVALPKALFLAFTGTPLIAGEAQTKEVFGNYVSVYDFQQSVEDGATVPLFYENRTPELKLDNPNLNDDIYDVIEAAELNADQEAKLEQELGKQYHILTRDDRLEIVAQDIVRHFLGRGFIGKAMVVSIDKATALRMHDKVKRHWEAELAWVRDEIHRLSRFPTAAKGQPPYEAEKLQELQRRLSLLETTDMALIVSPGQNEIAQMKALGLDIEPHRKLMYESQPPLDEKFKDTEDRLRLAFVCAMWLTGFDAPSCSTVYLDKPMRNHTLMQAIARANRVFPGKHSGMIVDYANVFASLEKALAIYGMGQGGDLPVKDKQKLVDALQEAADESAQFCGEHGVSLAEIEKLPAGILERLNLVDDAVNALISPDPRRQEFLGHERLVSTLYSAVKPDPAALAFSDRVACLGTIADAIRTKISPPNPIDISKVMEEIKKVLDESIIGVGMPVKSGPALDLSGIDFEALAKRFKKSKHKNTMLELLKAVIRAKLDRMIRLNRTRTDFRDKFEELIEAYNNGSRNIDDLAKDLRELGLSFTEEEQRHVRENLTEEELVILDILTRPAPELTTEERTEIKKVAKELIGKIKRLLEENLNWRQTSKSRAQMQEAIAGTLDHLPKAYSKNLYEKKCSAVFEHVYESYADARDNVYTSVG